MSQSTTLPSTVIDRIWPVEGTQRRNLRLLAVAVIGTALLTLSAKIHVPFYPVPMTMQTAVVFLLGLTLGPRLAVATVGLYLLEGAVGLPIFSGTPERGIGLAYMVGPTGGYLAGFLLAAWVCGIAASRGLRGFSLALAVLAAALAVYIPGAGWLASMVGMEKALALGVEPFLLGEAFKVALVVAVAETGLSRIRRNVA